MNIVRISPEVSDLVFLTTGCYLASWTRASYDFDWIDIAISDPTRLSGIPINKKLLTEPEPEVRETQGLLLKPGKFLRAILPPVYEDIPKLAAKLQQLMSSKSSELTRDLQTDSTPSNVYGMDHGSRGSLGQSCMNNLSTATFELYDDDPNMSILYLVQDGMLVLRALLHDKVNSEEDGHSIKLMDRVYVASDNYLELAFSWAKANGYHRKNKQNYHSKYCIISPSGSVYDSVLFIDCPGDEYDLLPYMDTFTYYCSCEGILHNDEGRCTEDTLEGVNGETETGVLSGQDRYEYHCSDCGDGLLEYNDYTWVGDSVICSSCLDANFTYCNHCEEYVLDHAINSVVTVESGKTNICDYCLENYHECEECGEYTEEELVEYSKSSYERTYSICPGCLEEEYYEECSTCGTFYPEDKEECPECMRQWRFSTVSPRLVKALNNRVANSPLAIKNSPGMFFYNEAIHRLGEGLYLLHDTGLIANGPTGIDLVYKILELIAESRTRKTCVESTPGIIKFQWRFSTACSTQSCLNLDYSTIGVYNLQVHKSKRGDIICL